MVDEKALLHAYLDAQRKHVLGILEGLSEEDLPRLRDWLAERLEALGGRILASFPDHIILADPAGNEFCIR
jgi:hypothetical protein